MVSRGEPKVIKDEMLPIIAPPSTTPRAVQKGKRNSLKTLVNTEITPARLILSAMGKRTQQLMSPCKKLT
jgi:hypothetical protein